MGRKPLRNALLIAAASLGLGACTDGYGYGGVGLGYGGYYGDYYGDYYGPSYYSPYYGSGYYGRGLGYGWYDNFYYPGTGYYVFDRSGRRHRWNDGQRRYWQSRPRYNGSWNGTASGRGLRGMQSGTVTQSQPSGSWSGQSSGTTVQGGTVQGGTGGGFRGRWRGRQ